MKMAGDCTHNTKYVKDDDNLGSRHALVTKGEPAGDPDAVKESTSKDATLSPYFEVIDGVLYRKKLEKGYIHYREVLGKDRRLKAIATFHHKRAGKRHHTLEDTYRHVAENYWWEGGSSGALRANCTLIRGGLSSTLRFACDGYPYSPSLHVCVAK